MRVTANPPRQYHSNGCPAAAFRGWTRRAVRGIGWEFVHVCIDDALFVVLVLVMAFRAAIVRLSAIDQAVALYGIDASSLAPAARPYRSGRSHRVEAGRRWPSSRLVSNLVFDADSVCSLEQKVRVAASTATSAPLQSTQPCHHARQPVRHV
jgi:hypothetical protein